MRDKGQNLVEIIIMLAVVAVGSIVILTLLGNNIGDMYNFAANKVADFHPFGEPVATETAGGTAIPPVLAGGSLGGTSSSPVKQCSSGSCNIDFGDYVLTGVPSDLGNFVETSGSSGGLDVFGDLLYQIAEQRKEADPEGYEEYLRLANLIHLEGNLMRYVEDGIKTAPTPADLKNKFYNKTLAETGYTVPPELASALPDLAMDVDFEKIVNKISSANRNIINGDSTQEDLDTIPAFAIVDQYRKIMDNPKYSENLKALTQEIYLNVNDLFSNTSFDMSSLTECEWLSMCAFSETDYDPITGKSIGVTRDIPASDADAILNPQYSLKDDLNGALVCTAGKNVDTSRSCHD